MRTILSVADTGGGSDAPVWVAIVVAAIAFVAAVITAIATYLGNRKTSRVAADANRIANDALRETQTQHRREEWWKRAQWAMERACDAAAGARGQRVGIAVLEWLGQSLLANQEERDMIKDVYVIVLGGNP